MRFGEVVDSVRATLRASRNGFLLVGALLVTSLTSTNFLMWMGIRVPEMGVSTSGVMAVRVVTVLLAFCAGYRLALSNDVHPWRIAGSSFRFAGALAGVTLLSMGGTVVIARGFGVAFAMAGLSGGAFAAAKAAVTLAALAFFSCLFLRVQPWVAALAAERSGFSLKDSWNGTSGRMGNILKGWAALVLPPYLAHFLLNLAALKLLAFGPATLMLAGVDGVVSTLAALAMILLNATVMRWAAGEAIPAPRAFAPERPPEELVEEARRRLRNLLGRAPRQPVRAE